MDIQLNHAAVILTQAYHSEYIISLKEHPWWGLVGKYTHSLECYAYFGGM